MVEKIQYIRAFNFLVNFNGGGLSIKKMAWHEVTGFSAELEIEEISEGGENQFTWRLPKPPKYKNLVLKRASRTNDDNYQKLVEWANNAINNFIFKPTTVTVSITGEKDDDPPLRTWDFVDAYPVRIQTTDLSAQKDELVIETLELAYKYFTRQ